MKRAIVLLFLLMCFQSVPVIAGHYPEIEKEYPADSYLIGLGEVAVSGDVLKDRARAETLARLDIAKQIRVRIKEDSIDILCAGEGKKGDSGSEECVNQLVTTIETRVSEVIEGSKIVAAGEDKERRVYYSVAVLPKTSINMIKDSLPIVHPSPIRGEGQGEGRASDNIRHIIAEGSAVLGDDVTPAKARAIALNNAGRKAIEDATGIDLQASTLIYNSELISDMVSSAARGIIINQTMLEDRCDVKDQRIYCFVRIEADVKPLATERHKEFSIIKASVQRPDAGPAMEATMFQNMDEIVIRVIANAPSFMNLFSVDQYGSVIKLYPNDIIKPELVPAGKEFVFPEKPLRA
ncbi:MAG: hypothetical protein PH343_09960, partial [Nitrospira sp.]|nr:hypothetical protein [Nitrospira sp.]